MSNILSDTTLIRRSRLRQLKDREHGWFDLQFIKALPKEHRNGCIDLLGKSRSQLRQDLIALATSGFKTGGFFVEFGATDGVELNNTWLMETEFGWSGILAEPARGWHSALKQNRRCTIDTRCVWRDSGETLKFTEAPRGENSAISTFVSSSRRLRGESYDVETISLNDLLQEHNAPAEIDYMSVDTEGSELDILTNLDWARYRFSFVSVEHNFAPQRDGLHAQFSKAGYTRILTDISRFDDWYVPNETAALFSDQPA